MLKRRRRYLEGLSEEELFAAAGSVGVEAPKEMDRDVLIDAILDAGFETALTEDNEGENDADGPVKLPERYNMTYVETLIRDPLWVFVYWEIRESERALNENAEDFEGYTLQVVSFAADAGVCDGEEAVSFSVPVGNDDVEWYLGFSPEGGTFRVDLCVTRDGSAHVLARSKPFRLPALLGPHNRELACCAELPLLKLSGLDDLSILRNNDRASRSRNV